MWTIFAQKSVLSAEVNNFLSNPQNITYYDWTNDNNYLETNYIYIEVYFQKIQ